MTLCSFNIDAIKAKLCHYQYEQQRDCGIALDVMQRNTVVKANVEHESQSVDTANTHALTWQAGC